MNFASSLFGFLYQCGDAFAFLVLAACGLAVIFGMMGVINLAHGEFIMCGAYVTVAAARAGLPLPLAILCGALAAGMVGVDRRASRRPATLRPSDGYHCSDLGAQPDRHARHADRTGIEHAGRRRAARQFYLRCLLLFDLPSRADGRCSCDSRRTVSRLQQDQVRHARPRHHPATAHGRSPGCRYAVRLQHDVRRSARRWPVLPAACTRRP